MRNLLPFQCLFLAVVPCFAILTTYNWGLWADWPLSCSTTCGVGKRCRERKCFDGFGKQRNVTLCISSRTSVAVSGMECADCTVNSKCPRQPGWSKWGEWSQCARQDSVLNSSLKTTPTSLPSSCQAGFKVRNRLCNDPPPDLGPLSIFCSGIHQEVRKCPFGCPDVPPLDDYNLNGRITRQVQTDHLQTRVNREQLGANDDAVKIRAVGEAVVMDCNTPAYRLANELLEARVLHTIQMNLPGLQFSVTWRIGGRKIINYNKKKKKRRFTSSSLKDLVSEEATWSSQRKRSDIEFHKTQLILPSVKSDDTGFYTCHISVGNSEWPATFFSLIVLDQRVSAPALLPFYLHSGVGFENPLSHSELHWYDAARLVWYQNGQRRFTDLLMRHRTRIRLIPQLSHLHQGMWNCFIEVPLPDAPTALARGNSPILGARFLVNTLFLHVDKEPRSLWELGARPLGTARMRLVSVVCGIVCVILICAVALTVWANRRWVHRMPRIDQLRCCVEEELDNQTRLLLTSRHRAHTNEFLLMQLLKAKEILIEKARNAHESGPNELLPEQTSE